MEQEQMEHCQMDIWKVNEFNFLNVRSPSYLKQKSWNIVYETETDYSQTW